MRLAVFTKNLTNPAYGAARLGAERAHQFRRLGIMDADPLPAEVLDRVDRRLGEKRRRAPGAVGEHHRQISKHPPRIVGRPATPPGASDASSWGHSGRHR